MVPHRKAAEGYERLKARYPSVVTRDLNAAKQWMRAGAGIEVLRLVASSKAQRLEPNAIDIRNSSGPGLQLAVRGVEFFNRWS